ncbi:MAG: acyl--CoA ligase [Ignavibacteria bacterium]|nr:acyl--CoA ligase [Ignavibacteria bacterium]
MTPLARHAEASPHATAVVDRRGRCTYAELFTRASRMAESLASSHHIGTGDRVATLLPNGIEHVVLIHALRLLDAVFVPLNTRLAAPELDARLRIVHPALLISNLSDFGLKMRVSSTSPIQVEAAISDFETRRHCTQHASHISHLASSPFPLQPSTFNIQPFPCNHPLHVGKQRRAETRCAHGSEPRRGHRRLRRAPGRAGR